MSSYDYDLIVIGSGPGGQRAAVQAAKLGKKALIIEKSEWGGGCLHTGTIPSKTLREFALKSGVAGPAGFKEIVRRKDSVLSAEMKIISDQLNRNKITMLEGTASFTDAHSVEVLTQSGLKKLSADKFVIGVGSSPCFPEGFPREEGCILNSDSILELTELPSDMAVLGAGVIGCEYASIFNQMGTEVTLIDRRAELLRNMDGEIIGALKKHFSDRKIELCLGVDLGEITVTQEGKKQVVFEINGKKRKFSSLLVCWGRVGNVAGLGLEKINLPASERGLIQVNAHYQTSVPNIYAVGDVIGHPALASSSAEQGRLSACHAFGHDGGSFPESFPYGIYTIPEISSAGLHEQELKEKAVPYVVGIALYNELARGQIIGDEHGLLKLLVHRETHRLLGVHAIGTNATELIHIGQVAMALDAKIEFLVRNVFNYPTLAEAYKVAAYGAMNQLS